MATLAKQLTTLDVRGRQEWRKWLEKNHLSESEIWLVFHKKHTNRKCITLADAMPPLAQVTIQLRIERTVKTVFEGSTSLDKMARSFDDLVAWLGKETSFPHGAILLTGTGIVPPDNFSLAVGDVIHIDIAGIGRLTNVVAQRA